MMTSRKAQGLSMNFVVVLAIALIVMVIIIGIFASRSSEGNKNLKGCEARNGVCVSGTSCSGSDASLGASSIPLVGGTCFYEQGDSLPPGKKVGDVNSGEICCLRQTEDK